MCIAVYCRAWKNTALKRRGKPRNRAIMCQPRVLEKIWKNPYYFSGNNRKNTVSVSMIWTWRVRFVLLYVGGVFSNPYKILFHADVRICGIQIKQILIIWRRVWWWRNRSRWKQKGFRQGGTEQGDGKRVIAGRRITYESREARPRWSDRKERRKKRSLSLWAFMKKTKKRKLVSVRTKTVSRTFEYKIFVLGSRAF